MNIVLKHADEIRITPSATSNVLLVVVIYSRRRFESTNGLRMRVEVTEHKLTALGLFATSAMYDSRGQSVELRFNVMAGKEPMYWSTGG